MDYKLPELKYSYDALEPYIDAKTMEVHYSKHHAGYTKKFNDAIKENNLEDKPIEEIFATVSKLPVAIKNNGGGYYNHSLFWDIMSPDGGGEPTGYLMNAIEKSFGSFDEFKNIFSSASKNLFGSGWAWLIKQGDKLVVTAMSNQDNPLMDSSPIKGTPILCLDVWEHAYYLKYQNKRPDYVDAFWNVVNWESVNEKFMNK